MDRVRPKEALSDQHAADLGEYACEKIPEMHVNVHVQLHPLLNNPYADSQFDRLLERARQQQG